MRIVALLVAAMVLITAGITRTSASNITRRDGQSSTQASDAWRHAPQIPTSEPTDPHERQVFIKRSLEFDRTSFNGPLDQPPTPGMGTGRSFGDVGSGQHPEIPFYPHEAIIVGTFTGFQTYITPSHRSIFTVVRVEIDRMILSGNPGDREGKDIALLLNGGTAIFPNGQVISSGLYPKMANQTIQPGHTYLLVLESNRDLDGFFDEKAWDLTNGVAQPLDSLDVERMKEGKAKVGGLPKEQALDAVQRIIEEHQQKTDSAK